MARKAIRGMELIFHLAADHGGRGYVDMHQAACAGNLTLDGLVFRAAARENAGKVVFASSGCVYPNYIQTDPGEVCLYLTEDKAGPPYDADNLYGWAKLMAEMTLTAYYRDYGLKAASCLLYGVRSSRAREPRGHRDDCARFCRAGSLRSLGQRRTDSELDSRRRYRLRHHPCGRRNRRRHRGESGHQRSAHASSRLRAKSCASRVTTRESNRIQKCRRGP